MFMWLDKAVDEMYLKLLNSANRLSFFCCLMARYSTVGCGRSVHAVAVFLLQCICFLSSICNVQKSFGR